MNFHIKRLFTHKKNTLINPKNRIYIKSKDPYITNRFLNLLSSSYYKKETDLIFYYNPFNTDYLESIYMPNINLYISSLKDFNEKYTFNIEENNCSENYINPYIEYMKHEFLIYSLKIKDAYLNLRNSICLNLDYNKFNQFKSTFINSIFNNNHIFSNKYETKEYYISSLGIYGLTSFSNYIYTGENKVFIMNDKYNLFSWTLIEDIIKIAEYENISYEIYKDTLSCETIDHIKIPSLNVCLISNNFLNNRKIPGIQLNDYMFFKNINELINKDQKVYLDNLLIKFKNICNVLSENYINLNNKLENTINSTNFNKLINEILNL